MNFQHLLVPLDGSKMAEAALPAAAFLAEHLKASVTLMHLIERRASRQVHGERHLTDPDPAKVYLYDIAADAFAPSVKSEIHVHDVGIANVARGIVEHAEEFNSDLIVMCSHGRAGFSGWFYGSIAQQVISEGMRPVLLIQPTPGVELPPFTCRKVLVPLDGQPEHEKGLTIAVILAQACGASLHLLMVVNTFSSLSGVWAATGRLLPRATMELLDMTAEHAKLYLDDHLVSLHMQGMTATAEIVRGDPVRNIVRATRKNDIDLIVLGTHGECGIDAFWSGRVAPRVSSRSRLPLLIVPVVSPEQLPSGDQAP
jgi:nucleotide-binding universal stress UspA family protein